MLDLVGTQIVGFLTHRLFIFQDLLQEFTKLGVCSPLYFKLDSLNEEAEKFSGALRFHEESHHVDR